MDTEHLDPIVDDLADTITDAIIDLDRDDAIIVVERIIFLAQAILDGI